MIASYYLKALAANRYVWGWGVGFMAFFLVLGAFGFSQGVGSGPSTILWFTASWFGLTTLFAFGAASVTVSYTIFYASSSLAYAFRFTRLRPASFVLGLLVGVVAVGLVQTGAMLLVSALLFSAHFHQWVLPVNPVGAIAVAIPSAMFIGVFSLLTVLIALNYVSARSINAIVWVPYMLTFSLGFAQLFGTLPAWFEYGSPFNDMLALLVMAYRGAPVSITFANSGSALDWRVLLGVLLAWIAAFLLLTQRLVRSIRAQDIEALRPV